MDNILDMLEAMDIPIDNDIDIDIDNDIDIDIDNINQWFLEV